MFKRVFLETNPIIFLENEQPYAGVVGEFLADAIPLAASMDCGFDCFYTNDYQLKQVTEANVIYIGA